MTLHRSLFLAALLSFGLPFGRLSAAEDVAFDERLSVFLADLHVNGRDTYPNGKPVPTGMRESMKRSVDEILAMNPRPRYVFVFGDIAYLVGRSCDYARSKPELTRLTDAGIRLTLGLGNHDHRAAFFDAWPEYRERTLVSNEVVTVTKMPDVDLILLDTLNDSGIAEEHNLGGGKGVLPEAQQVWVRKNLRKWKRPFLIGAHHHVNNLTLMGKDGKPASFADWLVKCPQFRGFVHGHSHRWVRTAFSGDFQARPLLTLPSNDCNGDTGYVLFRTTPEKGVATLVQKDFYSRHHRKQEGRPASWAARVADNVGAHCTFMLKK